MSERIYISLSEEIYKKLEELSHEFHTTKSSVIAKAIDEYYKQNNQEK